MERRFPFLEPLYHSFARRTRKQRCRNISLHSPHLMILIHRVERSLHCTLSVLRHRFQSFLRVFQFHLRLSQYQSGVGAFYFSLLLLPESFLCLCTRFEELRTKALDNLDSVLKQPFPVLKCPLEESSSPNSKFLLFPTSKTADKESLSEWKPKSWLKFSTPQHVVAGTLLKSRTFIFG